MAENKKSFILYVDLISVVEKLIQKDRLNKTNYAGELFYAILRYVNDKEVVDIDFIVELAFEPIKLSLKRDLKKFEIKKNERSESAKIGNLKRWHSDLYGLFKSGKLSLDECEREIENRKTSHSDNSDTLAKGKITNIADSVNDSDSDSVNVNVNVNDSVNDKKKLDKSLLSEIKISDVPELELEYFKIAKAFQELFIKNLKEKNVPSKNQEKANYKNYVTPIRLMMQKDEVTKKQMTEVFDYLKSDRCENSNFSWKTNILSTSKLREKFTQLLLKSKEQNGKQTYKTKQVEYSKDFKQRIFEKLQS